MGSSPTQPTSLRLSGYALAGQVFPAAYALRQRPSLWYNKEMKRFILCLLVGLLFTPATGLCQKSNPIDILGVKNYDEILTKNILAAPIKTSLDKAEATDDKRGIQHFVQEITQESSVIKQVNKTIGAVALIWLIILGTKFIYSLGEADKLKKYKQEFGWIAMGLVIVASAEYIGFHIFNPVNEILGDSNSVGYFVKNLASKSEQLVQFFFYLAAGIMLINGVMSGYDLIISSEDDQTIEKEQRFVKSYLIAMILIVMAETIIRILTFRSTDSASAYLLAPGEEKSTTEVIQVIIQEIMGLANYILTFIGVASLLMLIVASMYYVTSYGNEEITTRSKNIIIGCVLGVILGFSSFTIASFFAT